MQRTSERWRHLTWAILAWVSTIGVSHAALAQEPAADSVEALRAEITALRAEYEQRLTVLEERLGALAAATPASGEAAPTPSEAAASPTEQEAAANLIGEATLATAAPPPPVEPSLGEAGAPLISSYFNPAVSMIGNFLMVGGHNPVEGLSSAELRESELGLQAILDPYARADFFLSFGEEGVEVEEGYATFTSLPAGLLVKAGRMRVGFGKTNPLHLDVLPWADEPLPVVNLLGGDEGWVGSGLSVARIIPLPGDTFSEVTLQTFRGEAEGLFAADKRSDLAYNARYRVFRDLTEATNLDFGLSYGRGPNGSEVGADTSLQGIDVTLRWKPLQTAIYRGLTLRGEAIRSRRQQPGEDPSALGWLAAGEYRLARRWFVGGRYEAAERAADDSLRDTGQALLLTFWPSEFSQVRGELRRRRYAEGDTANELLLQLQFSMGAHGAHAF